MSHLKYYNYEGYGQTAQVNGGYSQAVRVGDIIEIAGQGGWDRETGASPSDLRSQIAQAFANVDHTLKNAGGNGWDQVFALKTYHVGLTDEAIGYAVEQLKKLAPHKPVWTLLGVEKLGFADMMIEIDVKAHVPSDK